VPEESIHYPSAKAKKEDSAKRRSDQEAWSRDYAAKRAEEQAKARAECIERVAAKLYEFDRHNVAWDEAEERLKAMYRDRAVEVLAVI